MRLGRLGTQVQLAARRERDVDPLEHLMLGAKVLKTFKESYILTQYIYYIALCVYIAFSLLGFERHFTLVRWDFSMLRTPRAEGLAPGERWFRQVYRPGAFRAGGVTCEAFRARGRERRGQTGCSLFQLYLSGFQWDFEWI